MESSRAITKGRLGVSRNALPIPCTDLPELDVQLKEALDELRSIQPLATPVTEWYRATASVWAKLTQSFSHIVIPSKLTTQKILQLAKRRLLDEVASIRHALHALQYQQLRIVKKMMEAPQRYAEMERECFLLTEQLEKTNKLLVEKSTALTKAVSALKASEDSNAQLSEKLSCAEKECERNAAQLVKMTTEYEASTEAASRSISKVTDHCMHLCSQLHDMEQQLSASEETRHQMADELSRLQQEAEALRAEEGKWRNDNLKKDEAIAQLEQLLRTTGATLEQLEKSEAEKETQLLGLTAKLARQTKEQYEMPEGVARGNAFCRSSCALSSRVPLVCVYQRAGRHPCALTKQLVDVQCLIGRKNPLSRTGISCTACIHPAERRFRRVHTVELAHDNRRSARSVGTQSDYSSSVHRQIQTVTTDPDTKNVRRICKELSLCILQKADTATPPFSKTASVLHSSIHPVTSFSKQPFTLCTYLVVQHLPRTESLGERGLGTHDAEVSGRVKTAGDEDDKLPHQLQPEDATACQQPVGDCWMRINISSKNQHSSSSDGTGFWDSTPTSAAVEYFQQQRQDASAEALAHSQRREGKLGSAVEIDCLQTASSYTISQTDGSPEYYRRSFNMSSSTCDSGTESPALPLHQVFAPPAQFQQPPSPRTSSPLKIQRFIVNTHIPSSPRHHQLRQLTREPLTLLCCFSSSRSPRLYTAPTTPKMRVEHASNAQRTVCPVVHPSTDSPKQTERPLVARAVTVPIYPSCRLRGVDAYRTSTSDPDIGSSKVLRKHQGTVSGEDRGIAVTGHLFLAQHSTRRRSISLAHIKPKHHAMQSKGLLCARTMTNPTAAKTAAISTCGLRREKDRSTLQEMRQSVLRGHKEAEANLRHEVEQLKQEKETVAQTLAARTAEYDKATNQLRERHAEDIVKLKEQHTLATYELKEKNTAALLKLKEYYTKEILSLKENHVLMVTQLESAHQLYKLQHSIPDAAKEVPGTSRTAKDHALEQRTDCTTCQEVRQHLLENESLLDYINRIKKEYDEKLHQQCALLEEALETRQTMSERTLAEKTQEWNKMAQVKDHAYALLKDELDELSRKQTAERERFASEMQHDFNNEVKRFTVQLQEARTASCHLQAEIKKSEDRQKLLEQKLALLYAKKSHREAQTQTVAPQSVHKSCQTAPIAETYSRQAHQRTLHDAAIATRPSLFRGDTKPPSHFAAVTASAPPEPCRFAGGSFFPPQKPFPGTYYRPPNSSTLASVPAFADPPAQRLLDDLTAVRHKVSRMFSSSQERPSHNPPRLQRKKQVALESSTYPLRGSIFAAPRTTLAGDGTNTVRPRQINAVPHDLSNFFDRHSVLDADYIQNRV